MCAYHPHETMNFHNDETSYCIQARIKKSNKPIRMDNIVEFSSHAFNYIAWPLGIEVQQSVWYIHTQNGLVESQIERELSSLYISY